MPWRQPMWSRPQARAARDHAEEPPVDLEAVEVDRSGQVINHRYPVRRLADAPGPRGMMAP